MERKETIYRKSFNIAMNEIEGLNLSYTVMRMWDARDWNHKTDWELAQTEVLHKIERIRNSLSAIEDMVRHADYKNKEE
jgi:hypothetical protein